MKKQAEKLQKEIQGLEGRLESPGFAGKAPANVVADVKDLLNDKRGQLMSIEKTILEL